MGISFTSSASYRSGVIHRNLHPDAVMIKTKSSISGEDSDDDEEEEELQKHQSTLDELSHQSSGYSFHENSALSHQSSLASADTGTSASTAKRIKAKEKPLYKLGDFWFFHNPRRVGCPFSEGRADWGSRRTAPPEAEGGFKITEKSDVWALGVCVFSWCTRGLPLPLSESGTDTLSSSPLMNSIPLKWGPWVRSLIKMCLQRNPKFRASSADVYQFLVLASSAKR